MKKILYTMLFTFSAMLSYAGNAQISSNIQDIPVTDKIKITVDVDNNFLTLPIDTSKQIKWTVTNTGTKLADWLIPVFLSSQGTYFKQLDTTCGGKLNPGTSCTTTLIITNAGEDFGDISYTISGIYGNTELIKATDTIRYVDEYLIPTPSDREQGEKYDTRFMVKNNLKKEIKYYDNNSDTNEYSTMSNIPSSSLVGEAMTAWFHRNIHEELTFLIPGSGKDEGKNLIIALRENDTGSGLTQENSEIEFYVSQPVIWNPIDNQGALPNFAQSSIKNWRNIFGKIIPITEWVWKHGVFDYYRGTIDFKPDSDGKLVFTTTTVCDSSFSHRCDKSEPDHPLIFTYSQTIDFTVN